MVAANEIHKYSVYYVYSITFVYVSTWNLVYRGIGWERMCVLDLESVYLDHVNQSNSSSVNFLIVLFIRVHPSENGVTKCYDIQSTRVS